MSRKQRLTSQLSTAFSPEHLEIVDESTMHSVPAGAESHFRVLLVSQAFQGIRAIDRHRQVNHALADEFSSGLHALALHTWTPTEWFERGGQAPLSPPCLGGSKTG